MILSQIDFAERYAVLGQRIANGLALLKDEAVLKVPSGKYEVQGSDIYYIMTTYTTKRIDEAKMEIHYKYMDIQCILGGQEYIGYTQNEKGLTLIEPYNSERDVKFCAIDAMQTLLRLQEGAFAIFWPGEPHAPCLCVDQPSLVKKIVVKVRID